MDYQVTEPSQKDKLDTNVETVLQKGSSINFTQLSFRTTLYFLLFASTLTFICSIFVKTTSMRNILWIESTITGSAAFVYLYYNEAIDAYNLCHENTLGWEGINQLRYIDWAITTPLMLISLTLILSMNSSIPVNGLRLFGIIVLDWFMLFFGYLGENHMICRTSADILGFIPFFGIFWLLYTQFLKGKTNQANMIIFGVYFFLWSLYGVLYMFDEKVMNTCFNILDCIAKAFVAIGISIHFLTK
uniref:Bacteriorhodopsin-like protein n=1 Tax=viral metagenome TaxID=1070528 RepID=A0A6C0JIG9_9ZZZZ